MATRELQALIERLGNLLVERGEDHARSGDLERVLRELAETQRVIRERADELEHSLEEERTLYHDLFDRAPDAYVVTDAEGVVRDANGATAALLGREIGDVLGRSLSDFVATTDRDRFRELVSGMSTSSRHRAELTFETAAGARDVEFHAVAEPQEDALSIRVGWILRDVTARRRAEAKAKATAAQLEVEVAEATRGLAATNAQFRAAIRELPIGALVVGSGSELQFANRRAEQILGQTESEIAQSLLAASWPVDDEAGTAIPAATWPLTRALSSGETVTRERLVHTRGDGAGVLLEVTAVPVVADGAVQSVVVTFDDITESARRERVERDFVTNAAHELQTPLAAITSAIDVLQAGAKDDPDERDRFLAHIERASARLGRLTRALLVLARAQTRDEAPRHEIIELEPLLRGVAAELSGDGVQLDCAAGIAVVGNRMLLEQALGNLAENALKHAAGNVMLSAERTDGRVAIHVVDRGPGIASHERGLVFERFYRSDGANGEGFGLGLAIVREAIEAIHGELQLDTGPEGTRVSVLLPGATVRGR